MASDNQLSQKDAARALSLKNGEGHGFSNEELSRMPRSEVYGGGNTPEATEYDDKADHATIRVPNPPYR